VFEKLLANLCIRSGCIETEILLTIFISVVNKRKLIINVYIICMFIRLVIKYT